MDELHEDGRQCGVHDARQVTDLTGHSSMMRYSPGELPPAAVIQEHGGLSVSDRIRWLRGYAAGILEVTERLDVQRQSVRTTPENITVLGPDDIFVFGSNLLGIHGRGSAHTARTRFGAETGVGEGLTGRAYAFPTVDRPTSWDNWRPLSWDELVMARDRLFNTARKMTGKTFWLTRVGCGLAGFTDMEMAPLFADAPDNIVKPPGW